VTVVWLSPVRRSTSDVVKAKVQARFINVCLLLLSLNHSDVMSSKMIILLILITLGRSSTYDRCKWSSGQSVGS